MTDPKCNNCGYETDYVSDDTGFCQTCQRAYSIGYRDAEWDNGVRI
jgi:hypothetical protein